jgi:hypothetical protein
MYNGMEHIKLSCKVSCFKARLSAMETLVLVQKVYGNEALNRSNVFGGSLHLETEGSW